MQIGHTLERTGCINDVVIESVSVLNRSLGFFLVKNEPLRFSSCTQPTYCTLIRQSTRLVEEGLEVAVHGKRSHHGSKPKLDGEGQAHLVAIVCSPPPEGRNRWTLNLIRDRMIELEYVDTISRSTIHNELKKTNLNPGVKKNGVFLLRNAPDL